MALQTLSIDLEAKLAKFTADMGQAARVSAKTGQDIAKSLDFIKTAAGGLTAGLGVNFFVQLGKSAIDSIDALNDVRDATGASIENLSALEDIAARTGTNFDAVGSGLVKFGDALTKAKPGSDIEGAFKALNLSVSELKQLDPAEALRRTAVALSGFADDGNKARLAQTLFGESVRSVAPFLANLGTQGKLVATVTADQAREAEAFNRQLLTMQKNVQDATRALTSDFVTGINKAAAALRESGLAAGIATLFTGDDQYKNDTALTEQTEQLLLAERELARSREKDAQFGDRSLRTAAAEKRVAELRQAIALTQSYRKVLSDAAKPIDTKLPSLAPDVTRTAPKADVVKSELTDTTQRALDQYVETLQRAIERESDLTEVQRAQLRIAETGARGFSEAKRAYILGLAERVDAARDAAEQERFFADATVRNEAITGRRLADLALGNGVKIRTNDTMQRQLEEMGLTTDALEALRLARLDEALATEQQNLVSAQNADAGAAEISLLEQKITLLKTERDLAVKTGDKRKKLEGEEESKRIANTLNADVKSALSNAFRDTKNPVQAFGDALGNVVYTRLSSATAAALADMLVGTATVGSTGGLLTSFTNSISKLLSFDGGGYTGGGSRSGGIDGKGGFLGILHPRETIIDHTKGQQGRGGGITIAPQYNISIDSRSDRFQLQNDIYRLLDSNNKMIMEELRRANVYS